MHMARYSLFVTKVPPNQQTNQTCFGAITNVYDDDDDNDAMNSWRLGRTDVRNSG